MMSDSAALPLEDGWLVYRGLLCHCTSSRLIGQQQSQPSSNTPPIPNSPLHSSNHEEDHLSGRIQFLSEEQRLNWLQTVPLSSGHLASCQLVLVKTRANIHFTSEQVQQLKFEGVLYDKLALSEINTSPSQSRSLAPNSNSKPILSIKTSLTRTITRPSSLLPHLRPLEDGRLALILPDLGGTTLRRLMSDHASSLPSSSWNSPYPHSRRTLTRTSFSTPPASSASKRSFSVSGTTTPIQEYRSSAAIQATSTNSPTAASQVQLTLASIQLAISYTLAVATKLHQLHQLSLIHRSLTPATILLNPSTKDVEFLSLSNASYSIKDRVEPDMNLSIYSSSTWMYLSPESSGKANRIIDVRSDLYSLGVIMYELVTGHPPFQSNDTLELIHMHLAKAPPSIISKSITLESHPHLFPALSVTSSIIMKLLQKQAEDRYQSTRGLIHDLSAVLQIMQTEFPQSIEISSSPISPASLIKFPTSSVVVPTTPSLVPSALLNYSIGQLDLYSTFRISQKLYGRSTEVGLLIKAYQRISTSISYSPPSITESISTSKRGSFSSGSTRSSSGSSIAEAALDYGPIVSPQLFLIRGYSGIGKTSLVDELHKHIVRQRGLFARGKFDLLKRDSSCLLQAFRQLIVQLLVTDAITWKVRLLRALGTNGQIICDIIPELTRLIGEQPPVPKLSTAETANRFNSVFCQFVCALATSTSPLTLFIDDLQWADNGSLSLINLLLSQESAHLLLIGAYRDNEVDAAHPLTRLINDVSTTQPDHITIVTLRPLSTSHVVQLLCDSFRCTPEIAQPLAQFLHVRTGGNPFFINTMLRSFYDQQLLTFNFQTAAWEWNLDEMCLSAVQEDVVEVLCKQMLTLSPDSQTLLQYAACMGASFNAQILSVVTEFSIARLVKAIREVEQSGLMICARSCDLLLLSETVAATGSSSTSPSILSPTRAACLAKSEPNSLPPTSSPLLLTSIVLTFMHDRIQQAAYRLIQPEALPDIHKRIACQLMHTYQSEEEQHEYAKEICTHINCGLEVDTNDSQWTEACQTRWNEFLATGHLHRVIELELIAARQAKSACGYEIAINYLNAAIRLLARKNPSTSPLSSDEFLRLDSSCWKESTSLCRRIYQELTICFLLTTNYLCAQHCVEYALSELKDDRDKAQLFELHIQSFNFQSDLKGGLAVGLEHLKSLGTELLPTEMSPELAEWTFAFPSLDDESTYHLHPIFQLEEMTEHTVEMTLLGSIFPNLFFLSDPRLWNCAITMNNLTRLHGVSIEAAHSMAIVGLCLWPTHAHQKCYAIGKLAMMLSERYGDLGKSILPRTNAVVLGTIYPWKVHLRTNVQLIDAAFEEANIIGDHEWWSILGLHVAEQPFLANLSFPTIMARSQQLYATLLKRKMVFPAEYCRIWLTFVETMAGVTNSRPSVELPIPLVQLTINLTQGLLHFFSRRMNEAVTALQIANQLSAAVPGSPQISNVVFYLCLALLQSAPTARLTITPLNTTSTLPSDYNAERVIKILSDADELISLMGIFSENAPMNYLHKLQLMQAERNRVTIFSHLATHHLMMNTLQLYEEATDGATQQQFHFESALSLELTGRFLQDCNRVTLARTYFKRAFTLYAQHGAVMKLNQLKLEFPNESFETLFTDVTQLPTTTMATNISLTGPPTSHSLRSSPVSGRRELVPSSTSSTASLSSTTSPETQPTSPNNYHNHLRLPSDLDINRIHENDARINQEPTPIKQPNSGTTSSTNGADSYDLLSVLKATSTFSTEKNSTKLLKRLMRIVLETAGATRGALVLEDANNEWCVELSASIDVEEKDDGKPTTQESTEEVQEGAPPPVQTDGIAIALNDFPSNSIAQSSDGSITTYPGTNIVVSPSDHHTLLQAQHDFSSSSSQASGSSENTSNEEIQHMSHARTHIRVGSTAGASPIPVEKALPISIFNYVLNSIETVLLRDPQSSSEFSAFSSDPYFASHAPRSLLCLPVLKAGKVFGVLYLENDFHADAFTSSHIQLLQLLCGQAALSLDNARLYAELSSHNARLEEQVLERTHELEERNGQLQLAKEEAERATKIKAEFLSNMSHEIRTPMNAVLGVGRLLSETSLSLEQQQYVSMINNSGNLLLTIINDILDYSKIEAGQLKLNPQPHNIIDIVETAVMLCYDMASTKGLLTSWWIDPTLPPSLLVDATRLQQILLNLLSNAIKFTKKGGVDLRVTGKLLPPTQPTSVVTVAKESPRPTHRRMLSPTDSPSIRLRSLSNLRASPTLKPATLVDHPSTITPPATPPTGPLTPRYQLDISVRDTGIGITPSQLATLFRSFSQVQHISGEYGGTGLGLVISKRLVEAMGGGEIRVVSEPGVGSTFSFFITVQLDPTPLKPLSANPTLNTGSPLLHASNRSLANSMRAPISPLGMTRRLKSPGVSGLTQSNNQADDLALKDLIPTLQLHGLKPLDKKILSTSKLVYISELHAAAESYIQLLQFYGCELHHFVTIEEAAAFMRQFIPIPPSTAIGSTPTSGLVLIADLDSSGISEEGIRDQICSFQPIRVLMLYSNALTFSRTHMSISAMDSLATSATPTPVRRTSASPEPFTPVVKLLSDSPATASISQFQPELPPFLQMEPAFGSQINSSTASSSLTSSPIPGCSPVQRRSSLSIEFTRRSVVKMIRKPVKIRLFLRELITLLATPIPPTTNPITNPHYPPTLQQLDLSLLSGANPSPSASASPTNSGESFLHVHPTSIASSPTAANVDSSPTLANPVPHRYPSTTTSHLQSSSTAAAKSKIKSMVGKYPLRILLAEDNLINQKLMVMMMRKLGYELLVASNGHEVLTLLEQQAKKGPQFEIECILMDASMDVMDGLECTRVIRSQQLPHRLRPFIIAQTANVTEEYRSMCLESGMDKFLSKPIHVEDLQTCLKAAYHAHHHTNNASTTAVPPSTTTSQSIPPTDDSSANQVIGVSSAESTTVQNN